MLTRVYKQLLNFFFLFLKYFATNHFFQLNVELLNLVSSKIKQAQEIFSSMTVRNPVSWNAMLAGFMNNGKSEEGLKLVRLMLGSLEFRPNQSTLSSALLACSNLSGLNLGTQIHQWASKLPLSLNVTVQISLVSMCRKCGHLDDA